MRNAAFALLLLPSLAVAQAPRIVVDTPNFKPLPIAVAPAVADAGAEAEAGEIAAVLRFDLHLSGLFHTVDPKSFLADPAEGLTAPDIRFSRWSDVGAEALVKSRAQRGGADVVAGDFRLYDVAGGREVLSSTVRATSARDVAHRFADELVRYYTREPGVFSTRIAAIRKARGTRELVLYGVDGGDPEVLVQDSIIMLPSWRPDGGAIAYTSYRGGKPEIWLVDVRTRGTRRLVSVGELATGVAWSPDGKRIAFAASVGGNSDIYVANADGSSPQRLTKDPATDSSPTWSPDGRRIAFVSSRSGNPHLFVMNADGSDARRLTFQGNYNQTPRWSPRGDLIAFTARDERKVFDLFIVSPETGRISRLTQDQGLTNEEPSWAPNGRLIAFTTDRGGGRAQLAIATVDGARQTVVTREGIDLGMPAWGPLK